MHKATQLSIIVGSVLAMSAALAQAQTDDANTQEQNTQERSSTADAQSSQSAAQNQSTERTRTAAADQDKDKEKDQAKGTSVASTTAVPFVTVLIPVAMETKADTSLANGCWAKLYGQTNFKGDSLTLVGPVDMPDMEGPFGIEWDAKVSSIKAGPKATVTIYDNEEFRDRATTVKPRQEVQEISEKMGLFEGVESIKVNCSGSSASG